VRHLRLTIAAPALAAALLFAGCGSGEKAKPRTVARGSSPAAASSARSNQPSSPAARPAATQAELATLRPFAASSPWNTLVTDNPVDPNSARYLRLVVQRIGTVETGNRQVTQQVTSHHSAFYINTQHWAPPIVDVSGGRPTQFVCRQLPANCGDLVPTLDAPADVSPLPQYDGWFTVTDRAHGVAYDFWRARRSRVGTTISYQFARRWDLNGPGFLKPTIVSARGSGLPLFAGVILPQEIRAGSIPHALAIALPGPAQRNYVQPASRTDGVGVSTSLPEGARIRLRPGFRIGKVPTGADGRAAQVIVTALERYGAIVVDRASVPTLFAQQNANWTVPADRTRSTTVSASDAVANGTVQADSSSPTGLSIVGATGTTGVVPPVTTKIAHPTPLLQGNELQGLTMADFDVVLLPGELQDPPPSEFRVNDLATP
jgi:hypothetical protein